MRNPKTIWLVKEKSITGENVLWCSVKEHLGGVEYIRKDLYDKLEKKLNHFNP